MNFELSILLVALLSPTYFLAKFLKSYYHSYKQAVIRTLNWLYLVVSVCSLTIVVYLHIDTGSPLSVRKEYLSWFWSVFLLSRCSEVFYSFIFDAYDKIKPPTPNNMEQVEGEKCHWLKRQFHNQAIKIHHRLVLPFRRYIELIINFAMLYVIQPVRYCKLAAHSDDVLVEGEKCRWLKRQFHNQPIEIHHRLVLAFRSYIELIINFAMLYVIQPVSYWKLAAHPDDVVNALYFSGVTITTLGYGDITPIHWFPQFLTVYEVLCGFSLIVVCFAVYLSKK